MSRRLERRIECGRDAGVSAADGALNIHDIVEEWQQNGFVFNVFPIVYPDHPDQFRIGETYRM